MNVAENKWREALDRAEQAERRVAVLEEAIEHMKRTSIGPDRNAPEGTEIWFMFADERQAALPKALNGP